MIHLYWAVPILAIGSFLVGYMFGWDSYRKRMFKIAQSKMMRAENWKGKNNG